MTKLGTYGCLRAQHSRRIRTVLFNDLGLYSRFGSSYSIEINASFPLECGGVRVYSLHGVKRAFSIGQQQSSIIGTAGSQSHAMSAIISQQGYTASRAVSPLGTVLCPDLTTMRAVSPSQKRRAAYIPTAGMLMSTHTISGRQSKAHKLLHSYLLAPDYLL